jgi:hypothetical protein
MAQGDFLNEKMELFCRHYVLSRNGTESAKQAGYAHASATNHGSKLLKDEKIRRRIEELEQDLSTDLDVVYELEHQYATAKQQGHGQTAIKALDMLAKIRGKNPDVVEKSSETLEREIIRFMEILGEEKMISLMALCSWNYSLPTEAEAEGVEETIKRQTKGED